LFKDLAVRKLTWVLLVIVAILGMASGVSFVVGPRMFYQRLVDSVKPGDTIQKVQGTLGEGTLLSVNQNGAELSLAIQATQAFPEHYPDAVEAGDVFLFYELQDSAKLYLQFRRNRLINFKPDDYRKSGKTHVGNDL
jgi:hypothetical protein